jgi:hypothetical protein
MWIRNHGPSEGFIDFSPLIGTARNNFVIDSVTNGLGSFFPGGEILLLLFGEDVDLHAHPLEF